MNLSNYIKKLDGIKQFVLQHAKLLVFIVLVSIFSFMVVRIYQLASAEPTDEAVQEKLTSLKITKLDQTAVDTIQSLEDRNISIESLFDNGRTNPFE